MNENGTFISKDSSFEGNITAKSITVEGEVIGDLNASTAIFIKGDGRVEGDIKAPKILLAKGCTHTGAICLDDSPPKFNLKEEKEPEANKSTPENKPLTKKEPVSSTVSPNKKNKLW